MKFVAAFLFVGSHLAQDDPDSLLDRLGSTNPAEREAAEREIRAMGEKALDFLRRAEQNSDTEVRVRAQSLREEIEWGPLLPPCALRSHADAVRALRHGTAAERLAALKTLDNDGFVPPVLADRVARTDPDDSVRATALEVLSRFPRRRYLEAYLRGLEDWERAGTHAHLGSLWRAVESTIDRSDLARLEKIASQGKAGAAALLADGFNHRLGRERLIELAQGDLLGPARRVLARRFGPEGLKAIGFSPDAIAGWPAQGETIEGLMDNGSLESRATLEAMAGQGKKLDQYARMMLARTESVRVARSLLAYADLARESSDNVFDALRAMKPAVRLEAFRQELQLRSSSVVRFAGVALRHGTEDDILRVFRAGDAEGPANLWYWFPPSPRPEVTRAFRRLLDENPERWAAHYAGDYLHRFDRECAADRARRFLKDPSSIWFGAAMRDLGALPAEERAALRPELLRVFREAKERVELYAIAREMDRDWIEPMRSLGKDIRAPQGYPALYGLFGFDGLTREELLSLATEHHFYFWQRLNGRLKPEEFDAVRKIAGEAPAHAFTSVARALITSGDARPFKRAVELPKEGDYPWGLAEVRVLTEGRDALDALLAGATGTMRGWQVNEEYVSALAGIEDPRVVEFLLERIDAGPVEVESNSLRGGAYHSDGPAAAAVAALVNLRSERLRPRLLTLARMTECTRWISLHAAAVGAMGVLKPEGALDYIASWITDRIRSCTMSEDDRTALVALGRLGDGSHVELVRPYLRNRRSLLAAAAVLDRLSHADAYRSLHAIKTLRHVNEYDAAELGALLKKEWGLAVKLPEGLRRQVQHFGAYPVQRADGFQILDRLASLLERAPLWKDGGVEFIDDVGIAAAWGE